MLQEVIFFKFLDRISVQKNPSERMPCKFNTAMDMCLYGQCIMVNNISLLVHEEHHKKTCLQGLQPVKTQTACSASESQLQFWNFSLIKYL